MTWETDSVWAKSRSIRSEKLCQVNCTDQTATAPWPTSVAQRTSDSSIPHLTSAPAPRFLFFFSFFLGRWGGGVQKSIQHCINSTLVLSYPRAQGKTTPFYGLGDLQSDKQGKSYRNPLPTLQSESAWKRVLTDNAETNRQTRQSRNVLVTPTVRDFKVRDPKK